MKPNPNLSTGRRKLFELLRQNGNGQLDRQDLDPVTLPCPIPAKSDAARPDGWPLLTLRQRMADSLVMHSTEGRLS